MDNSKQTEQTTSHRYNCYPPDIQIRYTFSTADKRHGTFDNTDSCEGSDRSRCMCAHMHMYQSQRIRSHNKETAAAYFVLLRRHCTAANRRHDLRQVAEHFLSSTERRLHRLPPFRPLYTDPHTPVPFLFWSLRLPEYFTSRFELEWESRAGRLKHAMRPNLVMAKPGKVQTCLGPNLVRALDPICLLNCRNKSGVERRGCMM